MRAGIAASRKIKAKADEPSKLVSNNSIKQTKANGKQRRNQYSSVALIKGDSVEYNLKKHRLSQGSSHSAYKNEYCVTHDRSISSLESQALVKNLAPPNGVLHGRPLADALASQLESESGEQSLARLGVYPNSLALAKTERSSDFRRSIALAKVANTADAFVAAGAAAKGGERLVAAKKKYYRKAIALMSIGAFIFSLGIVLAVLHFADFKNVQMAGPICLAIGLLLGVCGLVWLPIIKSKLKRQQQMMTRTFSL